MALISVGGLIFVNNLKDINWEDRIVGFTAFFTIMLILLTYSISDGLGFGIIFYTLMMLISRRGKRDKNPNVHRCRNFCRLFHFKSSYLAYYPLQRMPILLS